MSRSPARRLAPLALVAMLLLALLPTIGRLAGRSMACEASAGAPAAVAMDMASMDMAHMTPAEHRAHMAMMAAHAQPQPAPSRRAPEPHDGHDCPYCPLLSGLDTTDAPPWHPHAPPALGPWSVRAAIAPRLPAPVPALGAQGPPARLA